VGRANHLALTAGGTLIKVLNEIIYFRFSDLMVSENSAKYGFERFADFFIAHDFRQKSLLRFGDLQKVDDFSPWNDGFLGILIVHRAPAEAFTATRTGIQFNQLRHLQAVKRDVF
jgi:hypothetical protein